MSDKPKVMVELIIDRPHHEDLLYGTGVMWSGKGSVRAVPAEAWGKMARHTDVYRLVEQDAKPAPAASSAAEIDKKVAEAAGKGEDLVVVTTRPQWTAELLETMADADIHDSAKRLEIKLHPRLAGANLRKTFLGYVSKKEPT